MKFLIIIFIFIGLQVFSSFIIKPQFEGITVLLIDLFVALLGAYLSVKITMYKIKKEKSKLDNMSNMFKTNYENENEILNKIFAIQRENYLMSNSVCTDDFLHKDLLDFTKLKNKLLNENVSKDEMEELHNIKRDKVSFEEFNKTLIENAEKIDSLIVKIKNSEKIDLEKFEKEFDEQKKIVNETMKFKNVIKDLFSLKLN